MALPSNGFARFASSPALRAISILAYSSTLANADLPSPPLVLRRRLRTALKGSQSQGYVIEPAGRTDRVDVHVIRRLHVGPRVLMEMTADPSLRSELPRVEQKGHHPCPFEEVGAGTSKSSNFTNGSSTRSQPKQQTANKSIIWLQDVFHQSLVSNAEAAQALAYEPLLATILACLVFTLCMSVVFVLSLGRGVEALDESAVPTLASMIPVAGADLEQLLPNAPADSRDLPPWSSGQQLRFEAHVEGPVKSEENLYGPLTGRPCVAYNARVDEYSQSGKRKLAAYAQCSINFEASLLDAPGIRVRVAGEHVRMFDMKGGTHAETMCFNDAPEHYQIFALQNALTETAPWRCEDDQLEFQERALTVGSFVTLVGELRRDASGILMLTAARESAHVRRKPDVERWRTSWECCGLANPDPADLSSQTGSVLASDNPQLLQASERDWREYAALAGFGT